MVGVVEQDGVALGEGTAKGILTDQTHQLAAVNQGAESQQFGEAPVDVAVTGHFLATLDHRLHTRVRGDVIRHVCK